MSINSMSRLLKNSYSKITAVSTVVPKRKILNNHFSYFDDQKSLEKSFSMIGVNQRFWSDKTTTAADLCCKAAKDIFRNTIHKEAEIDAVIFITQSPNYQMPATVFEIHKVLGLNESALCLDVNLGCSGYVYGLFLSNSLISMGLSKVLLLAGETPSKFLDKNDTGTSILFGDAGSASIIEKTEEARDSSYRFKSRGSGFETISIPSGIHKSIKGFENKKTLSMHGPDVFNFTIKEIPKFIKEHIDSVSNEIQDYDYILLHQANLFMLKHIYKKAGVSEGQRLTNIDKYGNTSSATLPLLLTDKKIILNKAKKFMLVGFGVGLSWGIADIILDENVYINHFGE